MIVEIKVPSPGESISEVTIAHWMVSTGDQVELNQEIAEIESDKATLTLVSEAAGRIELMAKAGQTVEVGAIVCRVDTTRQGAQAAPSDATPIEQPKAAPVQAPKNETPAATKAVEAVPAALAQVRVSPVAKNRMDEAGLSVEDILNGLRRISSKDVERVQQFLASNAATASAITPTEATAQASGQVQRQAMSSLRKKLSQRLVAVKNETAMLTTFNEIDMSAVMQLRERYQKRFVERHGLKLGFMSFFTKAVTEALKHHPMVNAQIDGDDIVSFDYADIGIAVQTPKGLMVPVIRRADALSLAQIEQQIKELAEKARNRKISVEELSGGTFTITNGGTFGSLLSTPILNPPQSGILGMHNIVDRPVAVEGRVEIRPMMYVALSYDHRIIDGKDSVGFLVKVKELIEHPERLLFAGADPMERLLGI